VRTTGRSFGTLSIFLAIFAVGVQVAHAAMHWFTDASPLTTTQTLVIALGLSGAGLLLAVFAIIMTRDRWTATAVIGVVLNLVLLGVYGLLLSLQ